MIKARPSRRVLLWASLSQKVAGMRRVATECADISLIRRGSCGKGREAASGREPAGPKPLAGSVHDSLTARRAETPINRVDGLIKISFGLRRFACVLHKGADHRRLLEFWKAEALP